LTVLLYVGVVPVTITVLAQLFASGMVAVGFLFFGYVLLFGGLSSEEKGRVLLIALFFLSAALFGRASNKPPPRSICSRKISPIVLGWARRSPTVCIRRRGTNRRIRPSSSCSRRCSRGYGSRFGKRNLDPSSPAKFGLALLLLGIGFLTMMLARNWWSHRVARLRRRGCCSPTCCTPSASCACHRVGLSNITKLAPKRFVGQMLGTWFWVRSRVTHSRV
jgi:POT family proton-dependent oligopeptide transporter